ncbi:hypothetical protein GGH12_003398 [Coemansia sp. RSA 1822]|nr:hypothetical protein LPJ76_002140 [Coemansia sp. RSA 638]KAJ2122299.1 hypothetical protein IW147_003496 [Coemansia sp. RSA 720]KAJ2479503.1 hypothetical protein IWW56_003049 [Coemansia sp. RSA 2131]KAJ2542116.1 hypothetical protein GGF49_003124 [Coemansia sp. RSA 1853]KAJ2562214.1 hypothetical protein GGH12_003398 [Coemansia sp. RSA 1822]KAJ2666755.1 hypothetical protein IW148_000745 [Coemansia sp. RSA 1199]
MACECEHHHHHHHFCQPAIPPACWFLSHDRKEPCGCGGGSCEKYHQLMSKLVICGFNPLEQEDVIFLRNLVVHEAGNAEKTVTMFAKWKSGYNAEWHYKT